MKKLSKAMQLAKRLVLSEIVAGVVGLGVLAVLLYYGGPGVLLDILVSLLVAFGEILVYLAFVPLLFAH